MRTAQGRAAIPTCSIRMYVRDIQVKSLWLLGDRAQDLSQLLPRVLLHSLVRNEPLTVGQSRGDRPDRRPVVLSWPLPSPAPLPLSVSLGRSSFISLLLARLRRLPRAFPVSRILLPLALPIEPPQDAIKGRELAVGLLRKIHPFRGPQTDSVSLGRDDQMVGAPVAMLPQSFSLPPSHLCEQFVAKLFLVYQGTRAGY